MTFKACPNDENSPGYEESGAPLTGFAGGFIVAGARCAPLDVFVEGRRRPIRLVVSFGAGRCRGQPAGGPGKEKSRGRKPCPPEGSEAVNFSAYYLGGAFQGLSLAKTLRVCSKPHPDEPVRGNYISYIYGDCVATSDTGCAAPLEVQSAPACERNLSLYGGRMNYDLRKVRGVPAASFAGDVRLEVYTGDATVVIFGHERSQVMEAAEALRSIPGSAPSISAGADLPQPAPGALEGKLPC